MTGQCDGLLDVDFEMYGKDLTESAILSNKICRILGKDRNGFAYDYFLMKKGRKFQNQKVMEYQLNSG